MSRPYSELREGLLAKAVLRAAKDLSEGGEVEVGPYRLRLAYGGSGRVWVLQGTAVLQALFVVNPDRSFQWWRNEYSVSGSEQRNSLIDRMYPFFRLGRGPFTRPTAPAEPKVAYFTRDGVSGGMAEKKNSCDCCGWKTSWAGTVTVVALVLGAILLCKTCSEHELERMRIDRQCQ